MSGEITPKEMKEWIKSTWKECQEEAWQEQPQKREWVGLTDEEICSWFQENTALTNEAAMRITRAIEAKLKEKNT